MSLLRLRRLLAGLLAWLCLGAALPARGQDAAPLPRPSVTVRAGAATLAAGGFGRAWEAGPGVALRLDVPAYRGTSRLALAAAPFEARDRAVPAFWFVVATLGWGPDVRLPGRARLAAGPVVGAVHLRFAPRDGFGGNLQNETEAVVGAFVRASVPLRGRVSAWADAEVLRVALAEPRTLALASAGVALRLEVPPGLARLAE